jgi:pimeloyl-ACP methyl ester carboxylesterase
MVHAPGLNAITWRLVRSSDAVASWSLRGMLHRTAPSPELIAMVQAAARPGASRAWTGFQRRETRWSGPRTYFGAALSRVTCPATFLAGERDMLVSPADVRAAADRLPHAEFVSVAGAGHWLPRDAPDAVEEAVIAMLDRT